MGRLLRSAGTLEQVRVVSGRVPTIKGRTCIGGFDVNISIPYRNGRNVEAAQLTDELLFTHPFLGPLLAVLKQYLVHTGLSEDYNGGVGGMALVCLVTVYLLVRLIQ